MQTTEYKFPLEKHPAAKGICPKCKENKTFRYFKNFSRDYGICDRQNNCGYTNIPDKENGSLIASLAVPLPKVELVLPASEFCNTAINNQSSFFHTFCMNVLKISSEHLRRWNCGTIEDKTAFVYQNKEKQFYNIKKIEYLDNGKRNKESVPTYLKARAGSKYPVCLFGEHMLSQEKNICLVESEKTAIISSFFYPEFDWLATGGANSLTSDKIEVLYGRNVIYLCDSDHVGTNNSSIKKLKAGIQNCIIRHLFPDKGDGYDLADAIIEGLKPEIKFDAIDKLEQAKKPEPFYKLKYDTDEETGQKYVKDVVINYTAWIELLYSFGFRRFDIGKNFIFVKIDKKIIEEVTITQIQDYFISYLKSLVNESGTSNVIRLLIDKFYKNPAYYFCTNRLSLLVPNDKIIFNGDTQNEGFTYFKNGFVRVTKDGWDLCDYSQLNGYIWKEQILPKDFYFIDYKSSLAKHPIFAEFMYNISGRDEERFKSLCSITGYNTHSYYETKLKATIFTDSAISEDAEGRTGKTLFAKALGQIKRYVEIAGKDFKSDDKYKYSACALDTQIVHINDAKKHIDFETFYNDITEGITVERKNQQPFNVQVKMIFSTNKTIKLEGGSSRDRSIEFELANHYSDKFSPQDEFKHWFFRDWNNEEWSKFYNFLMYCQWVYFNHGLIQPAQINLNKRKLLDHTCAEFVEFMEQEKMPFNEKIDRKELHTSFLEAYSDFKTDKYKNQLKVFTKWLILYAQYTPGFKEIKKDSDIGRSNNMNWIVFTKE